MAAKPIDYDGCDGWMGVKRDLKKNFAGPAGELLQTEEKPNKKEKKKKITTAI